MLKMLGDPPYQIYTNGELDLFLVGEGYGFADEFEYGGFSPSWSAIDGAATRVFKRLTPEYLRALRRSHVKKSVATERFKDVLKEYWDGSC